MSVIWSEDAELELSAIYEWVYDNSNEVTVADRVYLAIRNAAEQLDGPAWYTRCTANDVYRAPVCNGKYVVVYHRVGDDVDVLRVRPSQTDWVSTTGMV